MSYFSNSEISPIVYLCTPICSCLFHG
jgi:hypothetical protein